MITTVKITSFLDQKPGTSGLRKKTAVFMQPHYLESYVQAIFSAVEGDRFFLGGDGRFFNEQAIPTILRIAAANGIKEMVVGAGGIMSTPAASNVIRKYKLDGGIILSASHNPAGINGDFGVKFNGANGGPVLENITDAIYANTRTSAAYKMTQTLAPSIDRVGQSSLENMAITVVDPVLDYSEMMQGLFDFNAIRALFEAGFRLCFDAMHAVTGPYATAIFEADLGAPSGSVINALPLSDFGGGHPDPNPVWAKSLMDKMFGENAPDFGAASDGDGDRNMIVGKNIYVGPSDSLAVLAANTNGLRGVARSMPTSRALDAVAAARGMDCYEVPTGWKYFGNLLDAGKIGLCGEESAGTGGAHIREKDGIWAVLCWLEILAKRRCSVQDLMADHWQTYGRHYFARHDYENINATAANTLYDRLKSMLPQLAGATVNGLQIKAADEFSYTDPVDGSVTPEQGLRIFFDTGERAVLRLSGTGTEGATLRIYLERAIADNPDMDAENALSTLTSAIAKLTDQVAIIKRDKPDVVS